MEKSTATSKSKLDKKLLLIVGTILVLVIAGIFAWMKLKPTTNATNNDESSPNGANQQVIPESNPDQTYRCNNYLGFGYSFEVVYNDDGLVSVNTSNGSADLETERKRLKDTYQGNIENYVNIVKALCED